MQQIMNITDVRKNLSSIVASLAMNDASVVIVRDSKPEAVLFPYDRLLGDIKEKEELWKFRFERLLKAGKKAGSGWAKKKGINLRKTSEEEKYALVKKI